MCQANQQKGLMMKYALLAKWCKDFSTFGAKIDKLLLLEDALCIRLFPKGNLIIVLNPQNSFVYYDENPLKSSQHSEIWTFLKNYHLSSPMMKEDDRILTFALSLKDIYGEEKRYKLICELMPPKPNVILLNPISSLVQDALYKYSLSENPMRMVLANQPYYPPKTGFSPDPSEDIQLPSEHREESLNSYFTFLHQKTLKSRNEEERQKAAEKLITKELKKLNKRLLSQKDDLALAQNYKYYQACAEALKPNLKEIKPGAESFSTINYLDPELKEITIPLQKGKSAKQNLDIYLKKYRKAKSGIAIIAQNILKTEAEIVSVSRLLDRLKEGELPDFEYKDKSSSLSQKVNALDKLLNFRYSDDWHIYLGRRAKENDFVTGKLGKAQDWWFHCRIYRGAHVLARNLKKKPIPDELIEICCSLAAWYSSAKFSINVPVDYTQIRYVRKPKGSPAGFVTYTNYKTVFATPKDLRQIRQELKR